MGIVIRLLRHIPASLLLTYTDERNAKMFHGFARFVHRPVAKLACRGPNSMVVNGDLCFAGPLGNGGAVNGAGFREPGHGIGVWGVASYLRRRFGFRHLRFFALIGSVLVSLLVLARHAPP